MLVPASAILGSTAIAVWLASRERIAGNRGRLFDAVAGLVRSLSQMGYAATNPIEPEAVAASLGEMQTDLRYLLALMKEKDEPVVQLVAVLISRAVAAPGYERLRETALFSISILTQWERGELTTTDSAASMPDHA